MQAGLLTEFGAPTVNIRQAQARNDLVKRYLSEFDTQLVLFDEVQRLNALARRDRMLLLDWMKWISSAGKASVVLSAAMAMGGGSSVTGQECIDSRLPSAWRECAGAEPPQTAGRAAGVAEIDSVVA